MTTTERSRRRNLRADICRVCGASVPVQAGWLYRDTHGRANRYTGRFGWLVKCDGCHQANETRGSLADKRKPKVAKVSATAVRLGALMPSLEPNRFGTDTEPCVRLVLKDGTSEIVVAPHWRDGSSSAEPAYQLDHCRLVFGGRELSRKAADLIAARAEQAAIDFVAHVAGE